MGFDLRPALSQWLELRGEAVYRTAGQKVETTYPFVGAVVTDYEEYTYSSGYCDSCYYEEIRIRLDYTLDGESKSYDFSGNFAELVKELEAL